MNKFFLAALLFGSMLLFASCENQADELEKAGVILNATELVPENGGAYEIIPPHKPPRI